MSFTVYSNRGRKNKQRIDTVEAELLPSFGYRTREDAERWVWRFRKANPDLKVELKAGAA